MTNQNHEEISMLRERLAVVETQQVALATQMSGVSDRVNGMERTLLGRFEAIGNEIKRELTMSNDWKLAVDRRHDAEDIASKLKIEITEKEDAGRRRFRDKLAIISVGITIATGLTALIAAWQLNVF